MAAVAPTQELPPWLIPTLVTSTINGVPVVQTSLSEASLTYFGPSIPLGDGWVFGGSTFPASVNFAPTSTSSPPPPSQPSSTTSLSPSPSPSPSPSTSSPSASSSPSPTSSAASSPTHSTLSAPSQNPGPTSNPTSAAARGGLPLIGKILIPILVVVVLAALIILFYFCYWRRRRRYSPAVSTRSGVSSWEHIEYPGPTTAGSFADPETGERDAFLPNENDSEMAEVSSRPSSSKVSGLIPTPWKRDPLQRRPVAPLTDTNSSGGSGQLAVATKKSTPTSSDPEDIRRRFNASRSTVATSSLFFNPARRSGGGVTADETGVLRQSSEDPGAILANESPRRESSHEEGAAPSSNGREAESIPLPTQQGQVDVPRPVRSTPTTKRSASSLPQTDDPHDYYLEGYMADEKRIRPESLPTNSSGWLTRGIMGPLSRLSWFRRVEAVAGPSGTRRSTPSSRSRSQHSPRMSRIGSAGNLSFRPSMSRPHSGVLHPGFGSRPVSGYSFLGVDPGGDLGLRPPGIRISGTGSTSAASGGTVYHTASSKGTGSSDSRKSASRGNGVGGQMQTVRAVDALDSPVPETTLPIRSPDSAVPREGRDAASLSSRATGPSFPPGLINVQMWDKSAESDSLEDETLEDGPPQAQGDWSSLRGQTSGEEREPRVRYPGEQRSVQITQGDERLTSEIGCVLAGEHETDVPAPSPPIAGFSLTPRVSMHAVSYQSGSHSSRPSDHTGQSQHTFYSSNQSHSQDPSSAESEEFQRRSSTRVNRVSLSAVGGDRGAITAPQLPPIDHILGDITMDSPLIERNSEEFERTMLAGDSLVEAATTQSDTSASVSTDARTTVLDTHHGEKD